MSQSAVLVAALVAAFVLYVAARGRLTAYSAAIFGAAPSQGGGSGGGGGGGIGKTLKQGAEVAGTVAKVAEFF